MAAVAAVAAVAAATAAAPAVAHPLGLPAFVRIAAVDDRTVSVTWNAAPDDVAALARSLGEDVGEDNVLSREEDLAFSTSPELERALLDGIVVEQAGVACAATTEVTSVVASGATVSAACPDRVEAVTLRVTLLSAIDERYRTMGVAAGPDGAQRVLFTAANPEHELRLDPDARAPVPSATSTSTPTAAPTAPDEAEPGPAFGGALPFEERVVGLVETATGPAGLALGVALALLLGALHGLAPGHGKSIAAAYLVGDSGRPRHAVALGAAVALMHTGSVLVLGFALSAVTQQPSTARLSATLQLASGVIVAAIGALVVARRVRERRADHGDEDDHDDHDHAVHGHSHGRHGHTHPHPHDAPLSPTGLVALGAAGGLLPSPSALLVLLTALAVGRVGYGLVVIGAFSVGLAITVTAAGLAALWGRDRLRDRAPRSARVRQLASALPLLGGALVMVAGAVLVVRALLLLRGA